MRLYLLILLIALPCLILYLLYGRAYLWAYRATRWGDLDAAPAGDGDGAAPHPGPRPLAVRRRATRAERLALGMPMRSGVLTVLVTLSAFASIALLAPQNPELAPFGVFACVVLALCAVVFCWLDRLPATGEIRGMQGVLSEPDDGSRYVPQGGLCVGGVRVLYPEHWLPLVQRDIGQTVDIELTEQGAVVRHGARLSLHEETGRFMYRPWQPTAVIAAALAVLAVASLFFYAPLGTRIGEARAALDAHRLVDIRDQATFDAWQPRVGDEVTVTGVTGDCAWLAQPAWGTGAAVALQDCREVAVGLPPGVVALTALDASETLAVAVSESLEGMLQTRRNATPEEVREHWRLAGQGSSQRWTLAGVDRFAQAVDALCAQAPCEARTVLEQAQAAPAARATLQTPNVLVLDAATAQALARAGFALAAARLEPVMAAGIEAARVRHASATRRLVGLTGTPLARVPLQEALADARDQRAAGAVGDQSPRLRMLRVAQALKQAGTQPVAFSGAVRTVSAGSPQVVQVDTGVVPLPVWMKLAPVIAWLLLTLLAAGAVLLTIAHRRRQRRQLAAIVRDNAQRQGDSAHGPA